MCTAISYNGLAGRTLDLEYSFAEELVVTPRCRGRNFIFEGERVSHYAMVGAAYIHQNNPLFYDAMNERGLYMAALNFPGYAVYREQRQGSINLASAELIPYILAECATLAEAELLLGKVNITPDSVQADLPVTPLHWLLTDGKNTLIIEPLASGVKVTPNPHGVLTNAPDIDYQMTIATNFSHLSPTNPTQRWQKEPHSPIYSRGTGAFGLPGDYSSTSRFIRAAFLSATVKDFGTISPPEDNNSSEKCDAFSQIVDKVQQNNLNSPQIENNKISTFFHLTDSLSVPYGAVLTDEGRAVYTVYASCTDLSDLTYYITTYACRTPCALSLTDELAGSDKILRFPLNSPEIIHSPCRYGRI